MHGIYVIIVDLIEWARNGRKDGEDRGTALP
jgi:hypothetical protein